MTDTPPTGTEPPPAAAPTVADPYRNYSFQLDITGGGTGQFVECYGLGARVHPIRFRESGANQIVHTLPGPVDYSELVLRYGLTDSRELWLWMTASVEGRTDRRNVSVIMLLPGSERRLQWNLGNAWACEWRAAPLDALGREAAIEELRISYDSITRA